MRLIFAGTPAFAQVALQALIDANYSVVLVMTQPDRQAGRGMRMTASPVKQLAQQHQLAVWQPESLKSADAQQRLMDANADLMIVAAYGVILPAAVLTIPRFGCINLHASLLPRWRGAAPIHRAIEAGDDTTGITVMQMDAGLDTGDILSVHRCAISETDTMGEVQQRLAALGAHALQTVLPQYAAGHPLVGQPQPVAGACYAPKIRREEAGIDWQKSAIDIARLIRAVDPVPGAYTYFSGVPLKVSQVRPDMTLHGVPGTVLEMRAGQLAVACGEGGIWIDYVQRAGGKKIPVATMAAMFPAGTRLGMQ